MANPVTDKQFAEAFDKLLLQELDNNFHVHEERPSGFGITVREFAQAKTISESTARRILTNAVARMGLKKKWMHLDEGHAAWVYYKP